MQDYQTDLKIACKQEVFDRTGESDDGLIKQEPETSEPRKVDVSNERHDIYIPSVLEESSTSCQVKEELNSAHSSRNKSVRRFDHALEKAIDQIKKGGSLETTAVQYGIPKDVIYNKLISRSLPKEMDILTSTEECHLVQWILRENKNNSVVLKSTLLDKVGKMKKVTKLTPIFAKSKFGKMWYEYFMRSYTDIYENEGILMPSNTIGEPSSSTMTSNKGTINITDLEESQLVEWILEMNKNNSLVFKHHLLEKVGKLKNIGRKTAIFLKSKMVKIWYTKFLKKHPEIYENDDLLMPSDSKPMDDYSSEEEKEEEHILSGTLLPDPIKIQKDIAKQLRNLGIQKAVVILHDFKNEKCLQCISKDGSRSVFLKNSSWPTVVNADPETRRSELQGNKKAVDVKCEEITSSDMESDLEQNNCTQQSKVFFKNKTSNNESLDNPRNYKKRKTDSKENYPRPICSKCNRSFCNKYKLIRHLATHIPKEKYTFKCYVCFKKFPSKYHFGIHLKLAHSKETYSCDECNSKFKHTTSLRKHKRTVHLHVKEDKFEPRRFICDICKKSFIYKNSLEDHIMYGHLEIKKKYSCSTCKKRFIKYSLMMRHKLRHVKTKPFACSNCSKTFSRKYILREHTDKCKGKEAVNIKKVDCDKISRDYLEELDLD